MLFSFVQMGNWGQEVKSLVQGHSTNEQEMRDSNSRLIGLQSGSDPFHQGSVFYFFYKDHKCGVSGSGGSRDRAVLSRGLGFHLNQYLELVYPRG